MGLADLVHKLLRKSTGKQKGEGQHLSTDEVNPLPKPTSVETETAAYEPSTPKSPGGIPEYVVRQLLRYDEVSVTETPFEEPQDGQARRPVGFYNGKHVIGHTQLRLRVRELFNSPPLQVILTSSTEGQKALQDIAERSPYVSGFRIDLFDPRGDNSDLIFYGSNSPQLAAGA